MKINFTNMTTYETSTKTFNGSLTNIRFTSAYKHSMEFRLIHAPYKAITQWLSDHERGEVVSYQCYIRISIHTDETTPAFILRYQVKSNATQTSYTITEKEKLFLMQATKQEIIRITEPYLVEIKRVNRPAIAASYINAYMEWAHPMTLDEVVARLTESQKLEAAKILKKYFAA